jgi:hypothetical protein
MLCRPSPCPSGCTRCLPLPTPRPFLLWSEAKRGKHRLFGCHPCAHHYVFIQRSAGKAASRFGDPRQRLSWQKAVTILSRSTHIVLQLCHLQPLRLTTQQPSQFVPSSMQSVSSALHLFVICAYVLIATFTQPTVSPCWQCILHSRRQSREFHTLTRARCFPSGRTIRFASSGGQSTRRFIRFG